MFGIGKKAASIRHGVSIMLWGGSAPDRAAMERSVDHGLEASVVMAVVQWLQRAIIEPELELVRGDEVITQHPMLDLLAQPNQFYSGENLLQATLFSWVTGGNGYWIKVDNAREEPVELWYAPHWMVEPQYPKDGRVFISGYKYTPGGAAHADPLAVRDVIHFRHGMDPKNPRLGLSPIYSALREVWSDIDASRMVAQMLKNNGVPGLVLSPKGDATIDDATEVKNFITSQFTGAGRGKPMVMSGPTEVHQYGFNPQQMDLSSVRNVSEERITALLGIPAAVVGFGTGLQQTKVGATMEEMRKLAWANGVIPILRSIEGEINRSLTPELADGWRFRFNLDQVEALQEDRNRLVERVARLVTAGIITRGAGLEKLGMESTPNDEVYLMPMSTIVVPVGQDPMSLRPTDPTPGGDPAKGVKSGHDHTGLEMRVAQDAPRARRIPPQLAQLATQIERQLPILESAFALELEKIFEDMGAKAERAALEVLDEKDVIGTERIIEVMQLAASIEAMKTVYERNYLGVANMVNDTLASAFSLGTDLPDPVAQAVIATGGRRAGLVDLSQQSKDRIFAAITELRGEGAGAEEIARRIRADVARGPWRDSATRSKVIARTEAKFAQNASTLERAKVEGMTHALIFDARLGATDEICEALNGKIVSIQDAEQLALDEHPNGSRSFVPAPQSLIQDMLP